MATIHITVGHNVRGIRTWTTADVCRAFERIANVDAYTAIPCYGMWRGEAEESTRIEVFTDNPAPILETMGALAGALEQDAVMVETFAPVTTFATPTPHAA